MGRGERQARGIRSEGVLRSSPSAPRIDDRKVAHAVPCVLDDHDYRTLEYIRGDRQHGCEAIDHVWRPGVFEPEEDDTPGTISRERGQIAEVEIEGEHDPIFCESLGKDLIVGGSVEPLLAEVKRVVPLAAEPLHDTHVDAHVGEETHVSLRATNFLAGQPRGVFERLLNVLGLEVGITAQDLFGRRSMGNLAHDHGHRDPHPADAGPSTHDLRIERDALEHWFSLSSRRDYRVRYALANYKTPLSDISAISEPCGHIGAPMFLTEIDEQRGVIAQRVAPPQTYAASFRCASSAVLTNAWSMRKPLRPLGEYQV